MDFEFLEDEQYFNELLREFGGILKNTMLFDFRDHDLKRKEFNRIRKSMLSDLIDRYGDSCQLNFHEECGGKATEIDHLIPLASNVLNKELRELKGQGRKKTPSQSFGSNHPSNFVLACKKCNAFKKHRMPMKETLEHIKSIRINRAVDELGDRVVE